MSLTTSLSIDLSDDDIQSRNWRHKNIKVKGLLRLARLCTLGIFLPAILIAGPVYLRYRVYSEQLYPFAASDQRLIDRKVSTTWCQRQVIFVNTTFNAYVINGEPEMKSETTLVSMTKHLMLEDDMKEYWGFYLLRGSNITVSTCVRWPGASLTIIRGHKHLHECAFIGDDSSEELDEILEEAMERGENTGNLTEFLQTSKDTNPSNEPNKMKKARHGVEFHHEPGAFKSNNRFSDSDIYHSTSHELDDNAMREILKKLLMKTRGMKSKQKHHNYQDDIIFEESKNTKLNNSFVEKNLSSAMKVESLADRQMNLILSEQNNVKVTESRGSSLHENKDEKQFNDSSSTSAEILQDILNKMDSLSVNGRKIIEKLINDFDESHNESTDKLMINSSLSLSDKKRMKRNSILFSSLTSLLNNENNYENDTGEIENLYPDGIADDRGTINETTFDDKSNSEFWSSFSSSEERLLQCKGLILNLPLTPHHQCSLKHENKHKIASIANTVTYRVPIDGYYFFVFSSENEVQTNYMRVKFDLYKTIYNTSNPVYACKNSTTKCSLPFNFFSWERTVLELPLNGNESQWNEEYVVISHCEPRTTLYLICIITVPLLILLFAFH